MTRSIQILTLALALGAGAHLGPIAAQVAPAVPEAPATPTPPSEPDAVDAPLDPDAAEAEEPGFGNERRRGRDRVAVGADIHVKPGETAHDVVVVLGDAVVEGEVTGDLVTVLGKATILGKIAGDVLNVGKGVWIENGALVRGDVSAFGHGVVREPDGIVQGEVANLGWAALPISIRGRAEAFFHECVMLARPLSPRVGFVWVLWAGLLLLQGMIGLLFPSATQATIRAMRERPGGTVVLGVLGLPLLFLTALILTITVVGSLAVPFLAAAVLIGLAIGRVALLRLIGSRLLRAFRLHDPHPVLEFGVGAILISLLLMIPFVGIFTWMVLVLWALGAILMALFRRDNVVPVAAMQATSPAVAPAGVPLPEGTPTAAYMTAEPGIATATTGATAASGSPSLGWTPDTQAAPPTPESIGVAPRPTLGRRIGALLIDWVPILFFIAVFLDRIMENSSGLMRIVAGVAYYTGMLAWRGTTLGGMVLGLRVVRLDGRPIDWTVALVRALSAILSGLCLGVGWFWAGWDERRQTWHDRLAGTVVIRDDHVRPLV